MSNIWGPPVRKAHGERDSFHAPCTPAHESEKRPWTTLSDLGTLWSVLLRFRRIKVITTVKRRSTSACLQHVSLASKNAQGFQQSALTECGAFGTASCSRIQEYLHIIRMPVMLFIILSQAPPTSPVFHRAATPVSELFACNSLLASHPPVSAMGVGSFLYNQYPCASGIPIKHTVLGKMAYKYFIKGEEQLQSDWTCDEDSLFSSICFSTICFDVWYQFPDIWLVSHILSRARSFGLRWWSTPREPKL